MYQIRGALCSCSTIMLQAVETAVNLAENVTGIDIDLDGDVGVAGEAPSQHIPASQRRLSRQRSIQLDNVAGYRQPTVMLLYLNGETPPPCASYTPYTCLDTAVHPLDPLYTPLHFSHTRRPFPPVTPRCTPLQARPSAAQRVNF